MVPDGAVKLKKHETAEKKKKDAEGKWGRLTGSTGRERRQGRRDAGVGETRRQGRAQVFTFDG